MLESSDIQALVDVRRHAGSRRNPQYSVDAMRVSLAAVEISYVQMDALGGRRKARQDSPHTAWRNTSFRGYADYMDTPEFEQAAADLAELASSRRVAIMCAEAVWWQCHRSLIADYFKVRDWSVLHLMGPRKVTEHPYTSAARVHNGRLDYSAPGDA